MKRKKLFLFLIIALIVTMLIAAVDCDKDDEKRQLKIQYIEESKVVMIQAPWAENISFSMYYGVDANGQNIITVDKILPQNAVISIDNYLQKYGYGDYFLVAVASSSDGFSIEDTLTFKIEPVSYVGGDGDDEQDVPIEDGKPVEGKLKSVYYFKTKSEDDLKIRLFNTSGVKSLESFMDLHSAWNFDSDSNVLSIKAAYINTLSLGAKIPLEIVYNDGESDSVYMQVADSVPMDIVKGGLKDSNIYSENTDGIIRMTPIIGFDLYLGYDGQIASSGAYVNAVVIDGVKLLQSDYTLSNQYTKITFSHTNEKILKLSHGLHFVEIYTSYGRSEVWIYLRKGVDRYPQNVTIDFDSSFPNISIKWSMLRDDAQSFAVHIGDKIYKDSEYPQLFAGNSFNATDRIKYLDKVKVAATFDGMTYVSLDDETLNVNLESSVIKSYLSYDKSFEFLGVTYNYYIRNFEEFRDMIFYSLINYSQLKNSTVGNYEKTLKFYADTSFIRSVKEVEGNFDTAIKYFNEAVKETHEIKAGYDGVYELNLKVQSTCIPNDSGREINANNIKENAYNDCHFSLTGRGEGYDGFAVNSYSKTANVKYSEELYMALERGIRPVPQSGSDAEKIYTMAKNILTRIVDDNMSDYQKVHAMADWLSNNVSYNWNLDEEVGKIPSTSEEYNKFYAYSEFYLEGVFLNRVAVCNGYAKAMSLMCGIEGIKCYKVKGGSGSGGISGKNFPQHAWNKVEIDGKWYVVDTTWANEKYSIDGKDTVEVLKHNTLFMSEKESGNSIGGAHYEMYVGMYSGCYAGESYDIFANTFFKYGGNLHDMVIDDVDELEILLLYIIESKGSGMSNNSYISIDVRCESSTLANFLKDLRVKNGELFKNFSYTIKYKESYGSMTGIVMRKL